jgi:DNA-damage-inducible protein J
MKSATVRARIEPDLKIEVGKILQSLGISFSEALEMFLHQVKLKNGIPFDIHVPTNTKVKDND